MPQKGPAVLSSGPLPLGPWWPVPELMHTSHQFSVYVLCQPLWGQFTALV